MISYSFQFFPMCLQYQECLVKEKIVSQPIFKASRYAPLNMLEIIFLGFFAYLEIPAHNQASTHNRVHKVVYSMKETYQTKIYVITLPEECTHEEKGSCSSYLNF